MDTTSPTTLFNAQPRWTLIDDPRGENATQNIQRDTALLRNLAATGAQARVWENPRCLVVTRRETRLPDYTSACADLAHHGWPVVVRDSGGTAVPHEPGVIHLSLIYPLPAGQRYDLDLSYQALCEPIRRALTSLGIKSKYGTVPGAYCDGRYNLIVNGRKITGTAQRLIPTAGGGTAILAQAMINVMTDPVSGTEIVNRFYRLAGDPRDYLAEASTSLDLELSTDAHPQLTSLFRQRLMDALVLLTTPT